MPFMKASVEVDDLARLSRAGIRSVDLDCVVVMKSSRT
jgi:hypothetical protein